MATSKLLFIVGVGRSGTTLLQSMLNAHPEVVFAPESHFIKKYIVPQLNGSLPAIGNAEKLVELLQADSDFMRLKVDVQALAAQTDFAQPHFMADVFSRALQAHGAERNALHLGDKDPMNVAYLQHIHKVYPNAYILHIIRDPRDVVLSRIKSDWGKGMPFFMHVAEYHFHIHKVLGEGNTLFGNRFLQVHYEDLIDQPEAELKRLCEGMELAYSPEMLNFHQKSEGLVAENERAWKGNIFKPVMKGNKNKWKKGLSKRQVVKIEGGLEVTMGKLGYELSGYGNAFARFVWSLPIKFAKQAFRVKAMREKPV